MCIDVEEQDLLSRMRLLPSRRNRPRRKWQFLNLAATLLPCYIARQGHTVVVSGYTWKGPPRGLRICHKNHQPARKLATSGESSPATTFEEVLKQHGYGRRLMTIFSTQLPVVAEVYSHGKCELCRIIAFEPPAKVGMPPLVQTQLVSDEKEIKMVDVGQITSVWDVPQKMIESSWRQSVEKDIETFPVNASERAMRQLYNSHVGRARSSSGLTKKQITRLVENSATDDRAHMEDVLRKAIKAGSGMMRLVDSELAMEYLYSDYPGTKADKARRQAVGAHVLARDAALGGRFRRMPCIFVSAELDASRVMTITLLNGGWLTVDQSVRAGTEGRKFAERTDAPSKKAGAQLLTFADERIAHRLECLAMGEVISWDLKEKANDKDEYDLELDVREALKAMDLEISPSGAQKALVQIGRWSESSGNKVKLEPWTEAVLEASNSYRQLDQSRRRDLLQKTSVFNYGAAASNELEGRVDLTGLPCVCVDAKRTTFPDDAIGVRPRSSTGRKVVEHASKWEILVHITDVSDIYSPESLLKVPNLQLLQDAASRRGTSRYDLPLGPLHLMPPVALEALSLQTVKVDETSKACQISSDLKTVNRCVTLWAYIDERNGQLLDVGLERTLISVPISLSFSGATSLLDGESEASSLKQARAVLAVAERNLSQWSRHHRERNEAAQKREDRLSASEMVARERHGPEQLSDDGRSGFQRTRGHRIVDAALDLYGNALTTLLRDAKAPIPVSKGSDASRGGRVGTAPLRRYIDGIAQRQALAVLCEYGGPPLTKKECIAASVMATEAKNTLSNIRSVKNMGVMDKNGQRDALRLLEAHLAGHNRPVPAISTGRENEVVISGVGAVAKCKGVEGTLKPGDRLMVQVQRLNPEKGSLSVILVKNDGRR